MLALRALRVSGSQCEAKRKCSHWSLDVRKNRDLTLRCWLASQQAAPVLQKPNTAGMPCPPHLPSHHCTDGEESPPRGLLQVSELEILEPAPHGALAAEQFTDQTKRGRVVAEMYSHSAQCRRGASRVLINKDQVYTGRHCFLSQEVPQVLRRGAG